MATTDGKRVAVLVSVTSQSLFVIGFVTQPASFGALTLLVGSPGL